MKSNKSMNITRRSAIYLGLGTTATFLAACSNSGGSSSSSSDSGDVSNKKVVLILPGSIDDQGWNSTNNAGATAASNELGINIDVVESVPEEDFESTFTEYGEKGYDLVMAAGSQFDQTCTSVAPQYPDTKFTIVNGQESKSPNQVPVFPKEYEGSYLCGILAGYYSKNGQFATLGGESNAPMVKLLDTFEAMAVQTAKQRGIANASSKRSFVNSFSDVAATKNMASSMIDQGADMVFCYSNEGTSGAIQAASEAGVNFVGFSSNKNAEADCVVGSVEMDWAHVYPTIVRDVLEGTWTGYQEIGVAEGAFKTDYRDDATQELRDTIDSASQDIIDDKVDFKQYFSEQ